MRDLAKTARSLIFIMAKAHIPLYIHADYLRNASGMYNLTEFE